jgi:hypothetical protein
MRPFAGTEAIRQFVNPRSMHTGVKLRLLTCKFRKKTTKEFVLVQAPKALLTLTSGKGSALYPAPPLSVLESPDGEQVGLEIQLAWNMC